MSQHYRQQLDEIRKGFPQPVSDPVHDSYFVFSILRALDQLDDMKSEIPILGKTRELDYEQALEAKLPPEGSSIESVTRELVEQLEGLPIFGHPRAQVNVVAPPTISSIIGALIPAIYNPNLVSDDTSRGVAVAEVRVAAMAADLVGYDPQKSGGVFTFGGTGTLLYGIKLGLEKAIPGAMEDGVREEVVVFASGQSHYSRLNVAGWLGIGERSLVEIPTHLDNDIRLEILETEARRALSEGKKIGAFIATMGTTDAFGIDDLAGMATLRDRLVEEFDLPYRPHIHADAVIGWAWSVFRNYDFEANPLGFRPGTVRSLAGALRRIGTLDLADSMGIDFHKTGFAPYISSLFLARDRNDLAPLQRSREEMPYLFQTGLRHPGTYTLETTRSGSGVLAALGNLLLLGRDGLRVIIGHLVEMAALLREQLEGHAATTVLNGDNFGTVTLFRAYPDGVDTWTISERERTDPAYAETLERHNEYNRRVFHGVHEKAMQGEGVLLSMTDCYRYTDYGRPIVALKSYILSPFVDEEHVKLLTETILKTREQVDRDMQASN